MVSKNIYETTVIVQGEKKQWILLKCKQRRWREVNGFGVCFKTGLANNGLGMKNEEERKR